MEIYLAQDHLIIVTYAIKNIVKIMFTKYIKHNNILENWI